MASPAKKLFTLAWSIGLAALLLVLTVSSLMPSTKSSRLDFKEEPTTAPIDSTTAPSTVPKISSSKVLILNGPFATPSTQPAGAPAHFYGSKSGVFTIEPPSTSPAR